MKSTPEHDEKDCHFIKSIYSFNRGQTKEEKEDVLKEYEEKQITLNFLD